MPMCVGGGQKLTLYSFPHFSLLLFLSLVSHYRELIRLTGQQAPGTFLSPSLTLILHAPVFCFCYYVGDGERAQVLRLAGQALYQHSYILSLFYSFTVNLKKLFKNLTDYSAEIFLSSMLLLHVFSVFVDCNLILCRFRLSFLVFVFSMSVSSFVFYPACACVGFRKSSPDTGQV